MRIAVMSAGCEGGSEIQGNSRVPKHPSAGWRGWAVQGRPPALLLGSIPVDIPDIPNIPDIPAAPRGRQSPWAVWCPCRAQTPGPGVSHHQTPSPG